MSQKALDVLQGIAQAAANAYDGARDENGEPLKIGLRREEGCLIKDSRMLDGFKVKFVGPNLCIEYQSEIKLKEVYSNDFESEVEQMVENVASYLKKEYKRLTGNALSVLTGTATVVVGEIVPVTGVQVSIALGNQTISGGATVSVSGNLMTVQLGSVTVVVTTNVSVTGVQLQAQTGSVTIQGNAVVTVTGNELTVATGEAVAQPWTEVDSSNTNTWIRVD